MCAPWDGNPIMPKRAPKLRAPLKIIRNLERALQSAKMEGASFGMTHDRITITGGPSTGFTEDVDSFVKARTRLYRESWLIPQIEEALAWARGE